MKVDVKIDAEKRFCELAAGDCFRCKGFGEVYVKTADSSGDVAICLQDGTYDEFAIGALVVPMPNAKVVEEETERRPAFDYEGWERIYKRLEARQNNMDNKISEIISREMANND